MDVGTYKKAVFKTLSIKPAKEGLRYVTRNTARTNVFHAAIGLSTEVGELLEVATPYLLEGKMTAEQKQAAFEEMGDIGYYLTVLAKTLKVKIPGAGKKIKLVGTRGKALLQLSAITADILGIAKKNFYGVLQVPVPTATNKWKLDVEGQKAVDATRTALLSTKVAEALDLFYRLTYDTFQVAPAPATIKSGPFI